MAQSCGGEAVGFMGDAHAHMAIRFCVSIFCRVGNERLIPHSTCVYVYVYIYIYIHLFIFIYTVYMIDKSSILLGQSLVQSFGQ